MRGGISSSNSFWMRYGPRTIAYVVGVGLDLKAAPISPGGRGQGEGAPAKTKP
jgi:hypothetical protein